LINCSNSGNEKKCNQYNATSQENSNFLSKSLKKSSNKLSNDSNETELKLTKNLLVSLVLNKTDDTLYLRNFSLSTNFKLEITSQGLSNITTEMPTIEPGIDISLTEKTILLLVVVITPIVFSVFLAAYLERRRAQIRSNRLYERLQFDSQNINSENS
jgi:hypothetical protein